MAIIQDLVAAWQHGPSPTPATRIAPQFSGSRLVREKLFQREDDTAVFLRWYETEASQGTAPQPAESPPNAASRFVWDENPVEDRMAFRLVRDEGRQDTNAATWLYQVHTDIPADVAEEYNAWYDNEHLPRLVTVPGVLRARRYVALLGDGPRFLTAYDLSDRDAFESPAGLLARKTPWTAKMRSLFFNTRRSMCKLVSASGST